MLAGLIESIRSCNMHVRVDARSATIKIEFDSTELTIAAISYRHIPILSSIFDHEANFSTFPTQGEL